MAERNRSAGFRARAVFAVSALTIATSFAACGSPSSVSSGTAPTSSGTATPPSPSSTPSATTTTSASSWVGVGELVVAKLNPTGAVSATPYQHTMVTASSTGTVQVKVPMSGSGMRLLGGSKPPVTNSVAQFTMAPDGTATDNVRSDFSEKLPLTVKVSYTLNGKPIQPSALAPTRKFLKKHYQSGTLQVSYVISNVTSEKTTVSFEGFNGAHVTKTISEPIPIVAEVKLTFPKDASDINAPGATLAAGKEGVKATWTSVLAPPLSGASTSLSYTVKLSKAKAPEVTVEAEAVGAQASLSGKVPASAAAALSSVEGQPESGQGGSAISLGQTNSDLGGRQTSIASRLESQKNAISKTHASAVKPSLSDIQATVEQLTTNQANNEHNTIAVGTAQLSGLRNEGVDNLNGLQASGNTQLNGLRGAGNAQVGQLRHTANHAVATLADEVASGSARANATASAVLRALTGELDSGIASLRPLLSRHLTHLSAAARVADALTMTASTLRNMADDLVTVATQHVADASALDQLIVALIADANAFPPTEQSTPEWRTLANDLTTAKTKADLVRNTAADIAGSAAEIHTAADKLQQASADLTRDVHVLSTEADQMHRTLTDRVLSAERNLESAISHVSGVVNDFSAQVAAAQSTINHAASHVHANIGHATNRARATIGRATGNAQSTIGRVTNNAQAALNAAGRKASADLVTGKQKVQATVQQARDSVEAALEKANSDYAQLLAVTQIAQANQLPGGNATGADVQNGAYVLRIASTG